MRPAQVAPPPRRPPNLLAKAAALGISRVAEGREEDFPASADPSAVMVLRAAVSPATPSDPNWSPLVATAVIDQIASLAPVSAGAAILTAALKVDMGRNASLVLPAIAAVATNVSFTAPGEPIAVIGPSIATATLSKAKLAAIFSMTNEIARSPLALPMTRRLLEESLSLALDEALLSSVAPPPGVPPGLPTVAGLIANSPLTGADAVRADIGSLIANIAASAGASLDVILVASPAQAAVARMLLPADTGIRVLASSTLTGGTVLAVSPAALVVAVDSTPRFDISTESVLHYDDSTPLAIGTVGAPPPNEVAAPVRSLFQTDVVAARVILSLGWAVRAGGAVAIATGVSW